MNAQQQYLHHIDRILDIGRVVGDQLAIQVEFDTYGMEKLVRFDVEQRNVQKELLGHILMLYQIWNV